MASKCESSSSEISLDLSETWKRKKMGESQLIGKDAIHQFGFKI